MSVLVVGMSHNSAPMSVLEQVARDSNGVQKLIAQVQDIDPVREVTVMATCNRIEVYAEVDRFHGSVEGISALLCEPMTGSEQVSNNHLYVHYDDGAVTHLFNVAAGLDSMVLGESQILGQAREALRVGQEIGSIGHTLNTLFQQALRIGKRSHAETAIDRAGPSVVSAGLERAKRALGALEERRVLILGAGSMAAIALNALPDAAQVYVANRTAASAERLAQTYGATPIPIEAVDDVLPEVDLIVSCTGSMEIMITAEQVAKGRSRTDRALAIVDLALPHDVDPGVVDMAQVELISLATLAAVNDVRAIVAEELGAFLVARRTAKVTPTLVALRSMATGVVDRETERLITRLPDLNDAQKAEVANAIRRVAEKLLHQPTIRAKELAHEPGEISYTDALAKLFALDPDAVEAVTRGGVQ